MKVTKFGHCCLLIEESGLRILTDPGSYTVDYQDKQTNIDVVLITHEHQDHFHIDSVKAILKNNPQAKIITNKAVGALLEKESIPSLIVEENQSVSEKNVLIEGFGHDHAIIHASIPQVENTGYFINNKLFYPGDAFVNPGKQVEVLALPTAGPWMKISEAIDYALALNPKKSFPVHDGVWSHPKLMAKLPAYILSQHNISFSILEIGKEYEF